VAARPDSNRLATALRRDARHRRRRPELRIDRSAASTSLVINQVDYDQAGTDASEFLELKNGSGAAINLDAYRVELVNGTGGASIARPSRLASRMRAASSRARMWP
jgi:hypothetical protein